jgi:hypothetical protein
MVKLKYIQIETSRHGRQKVYFRKGNGPRHRMPDDLASQEFHLAYSAALDGRPIPHIRQMPVSAVELRKQRSEAVIRGAIRSARTRARAKGLQFDLDLDYLLDMAARQEFRCALTGIEFFTRHKWPGRVDPYTPSIDRVEPALGYIRGNVRLVAYAVNAMLLDWGEGLFVQIANSYRYWGTKNGRSTPSPFQVPARTLKKR